MDFVSNHTTLQFGLVSFRPIEPNPPDPISPCNHMLCVPATCMYAYIHAHKPPMIYHHAPPWSPPWLQICELPRVSSIIPTFCICILFVFPSAFPFFWFFMARIMGQHTHQHHVLCCIQMFPYCDHFHIHIVDHLCHLVKIGESSTWSFQGLNLELRCECYRRSN